MQCHVSVRTLQAGFQRHLSMSPMAYVRVVRLRHAHRDLRSADPSHNTVAAIAHRGGFTNRSRFAAAQQNDVRPNPAPSAARCTLITKHGNGPLNANREPNSAN
jgi:transcriptional regulator GlxA family with amidase domain